MPDDSALLNLIYEKDAHPAEPPCELPATVDFPTPVGDELTHKRHIVVLGACLDAPESPFLSLVACDACASTSVHPAVHVITARSASKWHTETR